MSLVDVVDVDIELLGGLVQGWRGGGGASAPAPEVVHHPGVEVWLEGREDEVDVGLDRVVVDRAGGVDAGLEDQVGEGEDDCRVLVWEAGLGSSWSPRGPRSSWTWRG